jgi:hypothetical protein
MATAAEVVVQSKTTYDEAATTVPRLMPTLSDIERGIGYAVLTAVDEEGFEDLRSFSAQWESALDEFEITSINGVAYPSARISLALEDVVQNIIAFHGDEVEYAAKYAMERYTVSGMSVNVVDDGVIVNLA